MIIEKIAKLFNYNGPSLMKKIHTLKLENTKFVVSTNTTTKMTILTVYHYNAYSSLTDNYYYDSDYMLVKQTLLINNIEHVIFDKYKEIAKLVDSLNNESLIYN